MGKKEILKRTIWFLVIGIIFFFLFRNLFNNWQQIRCYQWKVNYPLIFLSLVIIILNFSFLIKIWLGLLNRLGFNLGYGRGFKIWFISNFGRYIPGKVWQLLGMVYLCEKEGIPKAVTTTSAILAQIFSLGAGLIISPLLLGADFFRRFWGANIILFYGLLGLFFILLVISLCPRFLERGVNFFLRKLKKPELKVRLNFRTSLKLLLLYAITWLIYGCGFFLFIRSFTTDISLAQYPSVTGIFAVAYILGFLSFLTPGGLGVREGILTYLLGLYFPISIATVISLASRIWMTIGEVVGLGISLRMR